MEKLRLLLTSAKVEVKVETELCNDSSGGVFSTSSLMVPSIINCNILKL